MGIGGKIVSYLGNSSLVFQASMAQKRMDSVCKQASGLRPRLSLHYFRLVVEEVRSGFIAAVESPVIWHWVSSLSGAITCRTVLTSLATAAITAGSLATAAYLDAKLHLSKDVGILRRMKAAERDYAKAVREDKISPWYLVEESCHKHWTSRAIWWRERSWTFGEMYEQTVRYAQWLLDEGIRPGDLVGFYLTNSPEFMMLWFATLCIGAAPAFLNYNLEGKALLHCLKVAETKLVIVDVDPTCTSKIEGSRKDIEASGAKIVYLDTELKAKVSAKQAVCPGDEYRNGVKGSFPFTLIYTR